MITKGGAFMNDNVIPIKPKRARPDKFSVFLGKEDEDGNVVQGDQVGLAFLNDKTFRLKLWMFGRDVYLIRPDDDSQKTYTIYSVDGYFSPRGVEKSYWNKIGNAGLCGNFLKLQIPLFGTDLYLSLFPDPARPSFSNEVRTA